MHKTLCVKGEYEADKDNVVLSFTGMWSSL